MTPENFVYWLQGYLELTEPVDPKNEMGFTSDQVKILKDHLALVLKKETPTYNITSTITEFDHINKNNDIFCSFGKGPPASC